MKKRNLFILIATLFTLISCDPIKNEVDVPTVLKSSCPLIDGKDDYLIFGQHFGFCQNDCVHLFKITTSELFADNMKGRFQTPLTFNSSALSKENYAIAAALCEKFPLESTNAQDVTLGCPDCHDQGTIYLELKRGNVIRTWKIDPDQNLVGIPADVIAYAKLVRELTDKLK